MIKVMSFKCPYCGKELIYKNVRDDFTCPYCEKEVHFDTLLYKSILEMNEQQYKQIEEKQLASKRQNKERRAKQNAPIIWTMCLISYCAIYFFIFPYIDIEKTNIIISFVIMAVIPGLLAASCPNPERNRILPKSRGWLFLVIYASPAIIGLIVFTIQFFLKNLYIILNN